MVNRYNALDETHRRVSNSEAELDPDPDKSHLRYAPLDQTHEQVRTTGENAQSTNNENASQPELSIQEKIAARLEQDIANADERLASGKISKEEAIREKKRADNEALVEMNAHDQVKDRGEESHEEKRKGPEPEMTDAKAARIAQIEARFQQFENEQQEKETGLSNDQSGHGR